MKTSKGQIAVTDFFVAIFIFSLIIIFVTLTWNRYNLRLADNLETEEMLTKAFQITGTLVESPGVPYNWTNNSVVIIGLASYDRNLTPEKVDNFINISIDETKTLFKIRTYDFYFVLVPEEGEIIAHGNIPEGKKHVVVKRQVIYKNEPAVLYFTLWK